ncbi:amino acid adenylation domain-containing protein [Xenorhabdus bovienii]|uniref:amino acid adenylation domain-containing protein n=1 Tax=Xenorhabdus bovienii TaxID=40576 RepID=UPI0023B3438F|nr:amino acid adenylation domain-containing protein [Xenorhabdus bovienii]MDE9454650.1 amino acid adenylation domain-containing protein [Xenorhabdus bovienii]
MVQTRSTTHRQTTMLHRFFDAAEKYPTQIAVKDSQKQVNYRDLQSWVINIANVLRTRNVSPGDRVAVELPPSTELIAALFAIQYVGAAYVPIDPKAPHERNQIILDDANPALIISDIHSTCHHGYKTDNIHSMLYDSPGKLIHNESTLQGIAYVIYTSGTTGRPKGVPITHDNLLALFNATETFYHFHEKDTVLLYHSYAFDFSVWEIWSALAYGGRLLIPDEETRVTPAKLTKLIKDECVTLLNQTPTAFSVNTKWLCQLKPCDLSLRFIIFGGERLNFQILKNWHQHFGLTSPLLVNMYGITETTIHASWHVINENDLKFSESNIGKVLPGFDYIIQPFNNNEINDNSGELLLSGAQVTIGYLNINNKSSEKFIWLEQNGVSQRYYRTGDVVQHNTHGELVYLGRCDQQVKINGYRIETGEIESVLAQYEGIDDISVIASHSDIYGHQLICFFTSSTSPEETIEKLKCLARDTLPIYMRPIRYRKLDIMPKTVNGKVDKRNIIKSLE